MGALKVELSDKYDNVVYFHTSSDIVYFNKRKATGIDALNVQDAIVQLNERVNEMIVLNEDMQNQVASMKDAVLTMNDRFYDNYTGFTETSYINYAKFESTNGKAPYTLTLEVTGVKQDDLVIVSPSQSASTQVGKQQLESYNCISRVVVSDGKLSFICYDEKPTMNIPIIVLVLRKVNS